MLRLTNKIIALLIVATILMVIVDGLLVFDCGVINEPNNNLRNELFEVRRELAEVKMDKIDKYIQDNTNKLNIIEIKLYNWHSPGTPAYAATTNVTIHNKGLNDVSNITLRIETPDAKYNIAIEVIHADKKITFTQKICWFKTSEPIIIARIYAGDLVLAEEKNEF